MLSTLLAASLATQVPEPPRGSAVEWQAPPACPDRRALADAITARLGREPTPDELSLVGRVERDGAGQYHLELRLTVDGHTQTRRLTTRRCAALVDAAALLVALALDPDAGDPERIPGPELAPEFPPDVAPDLAPTATEPAEPPEPVDPARLVEPLPGLDSGPAAPIPPPDPVAPPPRRRLGGLVRLSGGLELGALPGATAGVELAVGVLWPRARLEFHAVYLTPQTATRSPHAVSVSLLAAGARGCARLGRGRFEFPLCGGLELGGLRGEGRGPGARAATGLWAAALASAGAAWRFHRRFSLGLTAQGLARLAAPSFDLRADPGPPETLFASAPVGLRVLLGLELRLGDRP